VVRSRPHTDQRSFAVGSEVRAPTRRTIVPAPAALPAVPPRPHGNLDAVTVETLTALTDTIWPRKQPRASLRRQGLGWLLGYLAGHPGATWQERWEASGLNDGVRRVRELKTGSERLDGELGHSLMLLCCLRVVRPSLAAFRANSFVRYHEHFEAAQNDPDLNRFLALVEAEDTSRHFKRCARFDVAAALTSQGIVLADLTAEALLHYAIATREGGWGGGYESYVGHLAWQVLAASGQFSSHVPSTLRGAMRAPAMTPSELVDRHCIDAPDIRDLFVNYLTRRSHSVDYVTLRDLASDLCGKFWSQVVQINPQQKDLALSAETYEAWRTTLGVRLDGQPRLSADAIVTNIRAFYLDLQGWAALEPERWAQWVAPSPIGSREVRSRAKAKRRAKERMDARIRTLKPLLPAFVDAVTERRDHLYELLTAATDASVDQLLTVGSRQYKRLLSAGDIRHARIHGMSNVRVLDATSGRSVNVTFAEESAFWQWAAVETLRLSGLRCEELLELTQLSIRQYSRPNGEVVALLVVAPSKTDRERVIPMTAELFHVIAAIIRRLTRDRQGVPQATRYDKYERITSEPRPFLFQRTIGQRTEVITPSALRDELAKLSDLLALEHPELAGVRFTPHDFRRLFATDLVNHGLPIHIGAALLGHLDVQTTHGYVTVFQEDVIRHYQTHLAARRAARPAHEYRSATATEWDEFEEHFDKRKVELGQCGRPYATPCEHEHACIRCPMLHVDPGMIDRLNEIDADLTIRRETALAEGWLGELEGIDFTHRFLREKIAQAHRAAIARGTALGMPTIRGSALRKRIS
jgi:integrase